jgi:hypothetical protein
MSTRSLLITLSSVLILLLALLSAGCTGKDANQTDNNSSDNNGRIIVPEQNWKPAENNTNGESGPPSIAPEEPAVGGESRSEETTPSAINVALFINGVEQLSDRPIYVNENQRVECEFHIKSTGSELASYMIRQDTKTPMSVVGTLSGSEAVVPFGFTYVSRLWLEDGGIGISVSTKDGSGTLRQWIIALRPNPVHPGTSS